MFFIFFPAILLSNFDESYSNKFYHSLYDSAKTFNYDHEDKSSSIVNQLAKISETVAKVVYETVGDKTQPQLDFKANKTLINDLIQCYTVTANCSMFNVVATPTTK